MLRLSMTASVSVEEIGMEPRDRVHIAGACTDGIVNALPAIAAASPAVHTAFALGLTAAGSNAKEVQPRPAATPFFSLIERGATAPSSGPTRTPSHHGRPPTVSSCARYSFVLT
jgi:hypothetical protein